MSDFKVVGHSFNSKLDKKKGEIVTVYKVTMENDDGDKMVKGSGVKEIFTDFPLKSIHDIAVTSPQQTLLTEEKATESEA